MREMHARQIDWRQAASKAIGGPCDNPTVNFVALPEWWKGHDYLEREQAMAKGSSVSCMNRRTGLKDCLGRSNTTKQARRKHVCMGHGEL